MSARAARRGCVVDFAPPRSAGDHHPEMLVRLVAVAFETGDADRVAGFWASILDRDVVREPDSLLLPGDDTQVGLRFGEAATPASGPNRMHLHLTSSTRADQDNTVTRALALGARHIDVGQRPEEGHVVLADPGGNEFCVIEPGNAFLAGCGFLGEVTCDGTPAVGHFWRDALQWPLVWDKGQQTAIQLPTGGTKISWDVWSRPRPYEGRRQRFDLATPDLVAEVTRLVALGATELGVHDGRIVLADPDGGEFSLERG